MKIIPIKINSFNIRNKHLKNGTFKKENIRQHYEEVNSCYKHYYSVFFNGKINSSNKDFKSRIEEILNNDKNMENSIIEKYNPAFIDKLQEKIINSPKQNILIGISGESGSGKTTLCNILANFAQNEGLPIETISADNYFKDISALVKKYGSFDGVIKSGYDVDSPDNFDIEQLFKDLSELRTGKDVKIPQYLVDGTGISIPKAIDKKAKKIIIIEGISTMYSPVRDILDMQIFINIDPKIQQERYVGRAVDYRGQSEEDAIRQLNYAKGAAVKYIHPKKEGSDVFVSGNYSQDKYKNFICSIVSSINE